MANEIDKHWHLDRRIPIALIIGLLAQAATFVWWAGQTASQIEYDRRDINRNTHRIDRLETANADTRERMIAIEAGLKYLSTQLEALNGQLRSISFKLDKIAGAAHPGKETKTGGSR